MIEFLFQFGEFSGEESSFLSDLLVQIIGSFVGTGGALYLYYKKTKDQKNKEDRDREELQTNKLLYYRDLVKTAISIIDKLLISTTQYCEQIESRPSDLQKFPLPSAYELTRLTTVVSQEDVHTAYKALIKGDEIFEIFRTIDFYYGITQDLVVA